MRSVTATRPGGADRVVVCDTEVMADGPRRVVERASMRSEQGPVGLQGVVRIELAFAFHSA